MDLFWEMLKSNVGHLHTVRLALNIRYARKAQLGCCPSAVFSVPLRGFAFTSTQKGKNIQLQSLLNELRIYQHLLLMADRLVNDRTHEIESPFGQQRRSSNIDRGDRVTFFGHTKVQQTALIWPCT